MSLFKARSLRNSAVAAAILLFTSNIPTSNAHSWVEQVRRIAANGSFVGDPGYARGMIPRQDPGFADEKQTYLLPPNGGDPVIQPTDNIARFGEESYTDEFPRLTAAPGELIALRYQENGHVSVPDTPPNKPANRGTIFIYATDKAEDDDKLLDILGVWNKEGTGGDKRGKLIATRNYDDGQCRQINGGSISTKRQKEFHKTADELQGADLWCQVDVQIPEDAPTDSVYTMYWVWDWPTLSPELAQKSKNGVYPTQGDGVEKPEVYTSAIDIEIVAPDDAELGGKSRFVMPGKSDIEASFAEGGDVGNMAIKEQATNMFLVTPPDVDAPPVNGGDESSAAPSSGTESPDPSVTEAPEDAKATVTVTVTKEPTTLYTVVTKVVDDTAAAPTPTSTGGGLLDGLLPGPKAKPRRRGFGLS